MKKRKTCAENMAAKAAANRDKAVEKLFSTLESEAFRKFLSEDAPTRERKSNAHTNERDAHSVAE